MEVAGKERYSRDSQRLVKAKPNSDICHTCKTTVEDRAVKLDDIRWHASCFQCRQCKTPLDESLHLATFNVASQSVICASCAGVHGEPAETWSRFELVTRLTQFAYLLRIALSRLCNHLQITDSQLSSVDINITTKYISKEITGTKEISTSSSSPTKVHPSPLNQSPLPIEDKGHSPLYPTQINDVTSVSTTSLNRKVSRSFKTAKRSTVLGNASQRMSTATIPEGEEEDAPTTTTTTTTNSAANNTVPQRLDSLRRADQYKDLPALPRTSSVNLTDPPASPCDTPTTPMPGFGGFGTREVMPRTKQVTEATRMESRNTPSYMSVHPEETVQPPQPQTSLQQQQQQTHSHVPPNMNVYRPSTNKQTGKVRIYFSELSALQYMIARHVAVAHIEPYVRDYFTPRELLNLIETKKASIWGKLFTPFKHGAAKKPNKPKEDGTFGVSLELLTERTGVDSNLGASPSPIRVASFIDDAITALRQKGGFSFFELNLAHLIPSTFQMSRLKASLERTATLDG